MRAPTPMMQQYYAAKAEHPDVIMAIRIGDFFEFYGEDAVRAAEILEITLTGRDDGNGGRIPMAGVPFHSVEKYLARIVNAGLKVALCDQVEDPKKAKGLVRRAVTRVITPGTVLEESLLGGSDVCALTAIASSGDSWGIATLDPSTGELVVTSVEGPNRNTQLVREVARIRPAELIVATADSDLANSFLAGLGILTSTLPGVDLRRARQELSEKFGVSHLQGFGIEQIPGSILAVALALNYAAKNHVSTEHVTGITSYRLDEFVAIDPSSRRSLELTQSLADGSRRFTLLEVLDETVTPMGSRLLRRWIEQPLLDPVAIEARLVAVESLRSQSLVRGDVRERLKSMGDIERIVSRCVSGIATPRDMVGLRQALLALPGMAPALGMVAVGCLADCPSNISAHTSLAELLENSIVDEPPIHIRDGGVIRRGFDPELNRITGLSQDGKGFIAALEATERQASGINNLKVGFNSVFGYFLEVPKSQVANVPEHYIRKQTTANAERYITAELKDHEAAVLGASEKMVELEKEIFESIRRKIVAQAPALLVSARAIAELDVIANLAEVSVRRNYCRPEISAENTICISSGRHPVVEANGSQFVPNDLSLASGIPELPGERVMILTGPNMSGKSTYLRQTALIVLMAQIGSYVPAKSATVGICDAVFARVGAKDEIALGQSTFMVEMLESAYIMNHATERSLVILDEIGRGTSTYDGLAIAWAMVEEIATRGSKTMFATHYHQLNALADTLPMVANYRVSVQERGDEVIWTHKVLRGGTDRSYGIQVARMAGMPSEVVKRAAEVLADLEGTETLATPKAAHTTRMQLNLFEAEEPAQIKELREIDLDQLTPIQALKLLDRWKVDLK